MSIEDNKKKIAAFLNAMNRGGTGFIGNHVVRFCLEKGNGIRAMVMPGEDRSPFNGMDVEFVEGNLLDPPSLRKAVTGCSHLYHLAALFAVWTKDPELHNKINVDGARCMMEAAFNSWEWASEYILSKFISHHVVKGMCHDGLPATIVMPGLPFGPGDRMPTPTGTTIIGTLQGKMKNYWDGD